MAKNAYMDSKGRLKAIRRNFGAKKIDAFLVTDIKNVHYLSGFTGSAGFLLITRGRNLFFTDFRYTEQAGSEVKGWEIMPESGRRVGVISKALRDLGAETLGFESSVSYEFYTSLKRLRVRLSALKNLVEDLRRVKDSAEVGLITEAARRAERAFLAVKPMIRVGMKEREIALRLEEQLKWQGCRHAPFEIIVASGRNSSMPHAQPTDKKIEPGDFVIIDWGGEAGGYYADMTRTLLMAGGDLTGKRHIYGIVNAARAKAIAAVRSGVPCRAVDQAARDTIAAAGFGELFGHGTGHGVGLDVHEAPRISWTSPQRICNGMVFTVEPGVYKPGVGGVRIEDMVLVRHGTTKVLTGLSRKLEILR